MANKTKEISYLLEEEFSHLITPTIKVSTRSRDFNSVDKIDTIVLHWTGSHTLDEATAELRRNGTGYHFIIDNDGSAGGIGNVIQLVDVIKNVGHAGGGYGPHGTEVNSCSIGISFQCRGQEKGNTGVIGSTKIQPLAYNSLVKLLRELFEICPNLRFLTAHLWTIPSERVDPYTFNFNRLMSEQFMKDQKMELWKTGYYPFPGTKSYDNKDIAEDNPNLKLEDCKCLVWGDLNVNNGVYKDVNSGKYCKKSIGDCWVKKKSASQKTYGRKFKLNERRLSDASGAFAKASSDLGFIQDT